jgi:hypothetical protein
MKRAGGKRPQPEQQRGRDGTKRFLAHIASSEFTGTCIVAKSSAAHNGVMAT